ncbi:MAG: tRNA (5-methylaminomethyl-2-thiouridine)(34)-methyltransferase MnmD [Dysgonamonadaceae bacterium]|jgi:tRNA U34 5-methylaminomethyl-2-thiouridine-forming methyltransferase MnmC|nr:tRNA (5-methylaminomethyl-2-thiouridine)(34)-methyltransferase MnmD [Dysgonamonadaceae bacterium]
MEIQFTADGSHTLFLPEMNEHYHSVNGAVQESRHVYIEAGFKRCQKSSIHVLEIGFGTGLNALLTALEAGERQVPTLYTALEKYPLPLEIANQLNYTELDAEIFRQIHISEWETPVPITPFFTLQKIQTDFSAYTYPDCYDVVYYDAFAPDKQAGVWSQSLFDTIYKAMPSSGVMTTYCAKGHIRRMMQQAGFAVERIPGPPGKREMLRAVRV